MKKIRHAVLRIICVSLCLFGTPAVRPQGIFPKCTVALIPCPSPTKVTPGTCCIPPLLTIALSGASPGQDCVATGQPAGTTDCAEEFPLTATGCDLTKPPGTCGGT